MDTDPPALKPCSPEPSQAQRRGRKCGTKRLAGSRPSLTIGSQVHFCLCHLPSHLKGSHDGFIVYLNSFQLSLIILQISKSSQAKADRERNRPSAMQSLGLPASPIAGAYEETIQAISASCRWQGHSVTHTPYLSTPGLPCICLLTPVPVPDWKN